MLIEIYFCSGAASDLFDTFTADDCLCYSHRNRSSCGHPPVMRLSKTSERIAGEVPRDFLWFWRQKANLYRPLEWYGGGDWNYDGGLHDHLVHTSCSSISQKRGQTACPFQQTYWIQCLLVLSSLAWFGLHFAVHSWKLLVLGPRVVSENGEKFWTIYLLTRKITKKK